MANLKKLRRLTYRDNEGMIQEWTIKQLEQIPINDLHEICFDYGSGLGRERWARIDDVLSGDGFGSLKMVEIWPESIVQYLPRLNAKGIVELC